MSDPAENERRVTVRDIAHAAGVSHSTVSRALRGSPLVKKETREQLVALAERMGYRPDPMLSALTAYRSKVKLSKQPNALAFVTGAFVIDAWAEIFSSAFERANRLGFDLQRYIWQEDISAERQSEILRARGIKGIIIGPLNKANQLTPLPFHASYFSFVAIGRFLSGPSINTVTPNHFRSVYQATQALEERGYQRIGLALLERNNLRVDDRFRAAFLAYQDSLPLERRVPVCMPSEEGTEVDRFYQWAQKEKPDVILSYSQYYQMLQEKGLEMPEQIAFAALNLNKDTRANLSGTDLNDVAVGQAAVNLLHGQLLSGEIGIPQTPRTIVVDTTWIDGKSARGLLKRPEPTEPKLNSIRAI